MNNSERATEMLADAIASRIAQFGKNWNAKHGPLDIAVIADACVMVLENVFASSPETVDKVLEAIKLHRFKAAMLAGNAGELLRKLQ